ARRRVARSRTCHTCAPVCSGRVASAVARARGPRWAAVGGRRHHAVMTSDPLPEVPAVGEPVARKFEAAWDVFAATCGQYIAPEATFQAWFAHYLISQFGIDRVGREPTIRIDPFMDSPWKEQLRGSGHARLDAVVTRTPGLQLPHY